MIQIGDKLIHTFTVEENHTAIALGSGNLPVLSTPYMIACMENTAMTLLGKTLEQGMDSVGIQISTSHLKASKIGETISYKATITGVDGRKISFSVVAENQAGEKIGKSTHDRFIIDPEQFMKNI